MGDLDLKIGLDTSEVESGGAKVVKVFHGLEEGAVTSGKYFDDLGRTMTKSMKTAIEETEAAKNSIFSFSNILKEVGKTATGAIGLVTAALKPVADFDNYIGQLNQKITQVGGQLGKYKDIALDLRKADFFKPGEGGFGLSEADLNNVEYKFAAGTTAFEKFGEKSKENIKGFAQGAGMAMKTIGGTADQASAAMVDLHKTIGLSFKEEQMTPFVTTMANIAKSANMTDTQFYSLTKQVTGLAKAYGLSGEAGKTFVTNSLAVGAALSQVGLDASDMMGKMNAIATGSEQGLITSLILGFKKDDPIGQLKAFQKFAKDTVARTQGAGQAQPLVMQAMSTAFGANLTNEQMFRLAKGGPMEEPGKEGKDTTSILSNILDTLKNQDKTPWVTAGQAANNAIVGFKGQIEDKLWNPLQEIKGFMIDKAPALLEGLGNKIQQIIDILGGGAKGFLIAAGALAAIPTAITVGFGVLKLALEARMLGGLAGAAAGLGSKAAAEAMLLGSEGILMAGTASLALITAGIIGTAVVGAAVGLWLQKNVIKGKDNEKFGDVLLKSWRAFTDDPKKAGRESEKELLASPRGYLGIKNTGFGTALPDNSSTYASSSAGSASAGMTSSHGAAGNKSYSYDLAGMEKLGKDKGLRLSPGATDASQHGANSLHGKGLAADFGMSDKSYAQSQRIAAEIEAEGFKVKNEYYKPTGEDKWTGPHLHVSAPGGVPATSMAQANTGAATIGGLQSVHDEISNGTLSSIRDILMQITHSSGGTAFTPSASPLIHQALGSYAGSG